MAVCYKKLWKLLIDKDISRNLLHEKTGIALSTITKMKNNQYVSLEILDRICCELDCQIFEIVEIVKEERVDKLR